MALAYNTRRATRDLDGVFEPKRVVYEAVRRIATRHPDLPDDWLNDGVKGLMLGEDPDATVVFQHPGLNVRVASPRYLFSMKVAASRVEQDDDDIAILFGLAKASGQWRRPWTTSRRSTRTSDWSRSRSTS